MAKFIELTGYYTTDETEGLSDMGIRVDPSQAEQLPTLINTDKIETINEAMDGQTTIQFVSGDRSLFRESYKEVKAMILND